MADSKDWTWVLQRPCPECGFDASTLDRHRVATTLRAANFRLLALLGDPLVRERPAPEVWSALEYGCHVRDVHRLFLDRLGLMLDQDDPLFANWDQDATAVEARYELTDLDGLVGDLASDGERLAAAFDVVHPDQWSRTSRRSDGAVFTVETFGRYLVHDPVHHVWDVEQGYSALRG
ncbi:MAG: DinB family protein [Ilumatobacteraceae bacterium]